jgi:glyoxylase-like metal-dependent hydrolase (beta-lactamase superfamily II)
MSTPDTIPAWLPVSGSPGARIKLLLRRADALCCNSYIISTPPALLVIDPGAIDDQTQLIRQVLLDELSRAQRPVLFLLTHCHHDHSRSLEFWRRQQEIPVGLLAHEAGAAAIAGGNTELTLAYIFSQDFPPVTVDYPVAFSGRGELALPGGLLISEPLVSEHEQMKYRQLRLGDGLTLELYQTPGHSPDSICLRLGPLLFTGDILLADKPGVTGNPGWSKVQLLKTLRFMLSLLGSGGVETCCPGHGDPLAAARIVTMLETAFANAQYLNRLICLDRKRLEFLKKCAVALAREASVQFAVLGGRLQLAARSLEELGETELGRELAGSIDLDAVETFLEKFQDFAALHGHDAFLDGIPLRGVAVIGRIAGVLSKAKLPEGIAEFSLRRIELLLRDYINIMSGLDICDFFQPCDAFMLTRSALKIFSPEQTSPDKLDAEADSSRLFALYLARRLFRLPDAGGLVMRAPPADLRQIRTDPERLVHLIADCIERFAAFAGAAEISFSEQGGYVCICFDSRAGAASLNSDKILYYGYIAQLLGGKFTCTQSPAAEQACFHMPASAAGGTG